jgi:hypothetical protein
MSEINIEIDTPDGIERHIQSVADAYPEVVGRAAWQEFSKIMNAAKRIVPVEYGLLRGSGVVQEPLVGDGEVTEEMGFYISYAGYVERGEPHTLTGDEPFHHVGQSHFMEESWRSFEPELLENLCKRIDFLMKGAI